MNRFHIVFISYAIIIYIIKGDIAGVANGKFKSIKDISVSKPMTRTATENLVTPISDKNVMTVLTKEPYYSNIVWEAMSHVSNVIVRVYTGATSYLPCKLEPKILGKKVVWYYAKANFSYKPLEEDETVITDYNLTIYNTRLDHAGVYRCAAHGQHGGLMLLEVVDDEEYNVVKPQASKGPYAMKPGPLVTGHTSLTVFSAWFGWSECSTCELVGRRRRYGVCYVAITKSRRNASYIDEGILKLFDAFPEGIPCRSQLLPPTVRNIPSVQRRPNEIMLGLCKVKCEEAILEIRSKSGKLIESVNNTAGIYSLHQKKPSQPPLPARSIMFVEPGERVSIRCSGTTLRDVPLTWRADTQELNPRYVYSATGGRVRLNARDHIVFTHVLYNDTHAYSCWQRNVLAGVVKLVVERRAETVYRLQLTLFTLIIMLAILLRLTIRLVECRERYLGINM